MCNVNTVHVKGTGYIRVHPDVTRVTIQLKGLKKEYGNTLQLASESAKALQDLLKPLGFKPKDIRTVHFSVNKETALYRENGLYKSHFLGFRFTHRLKIEFDSDRKRLAHILYALGHSPLHPRFSLSFTVKKPESVKNTLLSRAVKDAREKARVLTEAAGVKLGNIREIDYSRHAVNLETSPFDCMRSLHDAGTALQIHDLHFETDDITASDTVEVVWEIK